MTERIKVAVIGAGRLGRFHAQKLAQLDHVELVAIVDPVASSRDRVAAECRCPAMAECGSLLGQIDAAVIAAPTKAHHGIGLELIEQGIHVLVEKPICTSLAEADELVDAARRRGVVLQVGHVERFNPAFCGALPHATTPKYIEVLRAAPFTFRSTDVGVVLDLMIHDLDLVLTLAQSPVRRVEALGACVVGRNEDVANARLLFENGCVASLSASRVSYLAARQMQVWTAEGFAGIDFAARSLCLVRPSGTLQRQEFDLESLTPDQVAYWQENFAREHLPCTTQSFDAVDALSLECEDFISAIRSGRAPRVSGEAGRNALAVAEQIVASLAEHAWDGTASGRVGANAGSVHRVVPSPHFPLTPAAATLHRAAG